MLQPLDICWFFSLKEGKLCMNIAVIVCVRVRVQGECYAGIGGAAVANG